MSFIRQDSDNKFCFIPFNTTGEQHEDRKKVTLLPFTQNVAITLKVQKT